MGYEQDHGTQKQRILLTRFPDPLPNNGTGKPLYLCVYDAIYATLKQGKNIAAGTSLPSESDFARYWNVSKGTIREALYHLYEDGIVQKSQGKRAIVAATADLENYRYQLLSHPVRMFSNTEFDHVEIEFHPVSNSDWLSERLGLTEGTVLGKGTICYYHEQVKLATTVFFLPFSLLEKEAVQVSNDDAFIDFIETHIYQKAEYAKSSICLIDEMEDTELPKLALPLLLVEEFLYSGEECFIFLRHYLDKDTFRINSLRKRSY